MSLKIYHIIKVTLASQHVQKATVPGFWSEICQKIHVFPANKHLKNMVEKRQAVLLTVRYSCECGASLLGSVLPGFVIFYIFLWSIFWYDCGYFT